MLKKVFKIILLHFFFFSQPPENELQKGGTGERVMSEHQLRVQRSLQKLNIPDWYKSSAVSQTPQGFLLKRNSDSKKENQRWPGLGSKTTSLSSLGSAQQTAIKSPTSEYFYILLSLSLLFSRRCSHFYVTEFKTETNKKYSREGN